MEKYRLPAQILKALAHPARLRILNTLRDDEQCVCHLTALLRQRQAYVSQQLMFLRQAGLIEDRKEGLRVYYRIQDPRLLELLDIADAIAGVTHHEPDRVKACSCPRCEEHKARTDKEPRRLGSWDRGAQTA